MGDSAKSFRITLGALIIKERLGTSDAETVEQIRENPYLQYFLGFSEYSDNAPFDASMFVHFRNRLNREIIRQINEAIVLGTVENDPPSQEGESDSSESTGENNDDDDDNPLSDCHTGQLIVDASCTPADIHYPTDLGLLNEGREQTERIIDLLYRQVRDHVTQKPRTYRRKARQKSLCIAKQ